MLARLMLLPLITISAAAQTSPLGAWRFEHGVAAPWIRAGAPTPDVRIRLGQTVRFEADRVTGIGALNCTEASYTSLSQPANGMFQGNLPAPARTAAEKLGVTRFPVPGVRLDCSTGSFDLHRVDQNTMLVALDNVIWTLSHAPGALALPTTPHGVVQTFLERHFAGDMGFDSASVAGKQEGLSTGLRTAIANYLRRPTSPNEVPAIDGDPFTDSQEYPTRFAVSAAAIAGRVATVTVRFSDGFRNRATTYLLRQQVGEWRITDVRGSDGVLLSKLLR